MRISTLSLLALIGLAFSIPAAAQFKMQTPAGEAPGPWIFGTIGVGSNPDKTVKTTALKGLAIKVGEKGEAAVAYDLDLCRMVGAWTGGKFTTPMNLMSRGEYPTALGDVVFTTADEAGFQISGAQGEETWKDPRPEPFGPLPDVKFRGIHVNGEENVSETTKFLYSGEGWGSLTIGGKKIVLKWEVAGVEILEIPVFEYRKNWPVFVRWFHISKPSPGFRLNLAKMADTAKLLPISGGGNGWVSQMVPIRDSGRDLEPQLESQGQIGL